MFVAISRNLCLQLVPSPSHDLSLPLDSFQPNVRQVPAVSQSSSYCLHHDSSPFTSSFPFPSVMATTATTPNPPGRHSSLLIGTNQRNHSVRTGSRSVDPPDAPIFLEQPLFLQGLSHGAAAMHAAGGSRTSKNGGSKPSAPQMSLAALMAGNDGVSNNNTKSKKRAATETLDFTHTTTNSIDEETGGAAQGGRQTKRLKMPLANSVSTTTTDGGKKKAKKAERNEKQEKLAQESAMWRAKYKKAFPSFTFYFDAIDEATKAQLAAQVKKLGSVSYCLSPSPEFIFSDWLSSLK